MNQSQLAINSISTRQNNVEEMLDAYAEAGFQNVEFYLPHVKERGAEAIKSLLDERGLRCIGGFEGSLSAFSDAQGNAQLIENAQFLSQLGAKCLVLGTDGSKDAVSDSLGMVAGKLGEVARQIEETGVVLCLEFNWSPLVKSLRSAVEVCERSGARNVGVLFDPAHYHCTPTKFDQINARSVAWIRHVHVNNMADKPGELSNCNSDRVLPPGGCLDLGALFGALETHGYAGFFSIEMFSEELWALPTADAARQMFQSLLPLCTQI